MTKSLDRWRGHKFLGLFSLGALFFILVVSSFEAGATQNGSSNNHFCTSRVDNLRVYLSRFGMDPGMANSILGHWRRGSRSSGVHFLEIDNGLYFAGDGPLGKDVSPIQICYTRGEDHFTINTSYMLMRQSLEVAFNGGSSFEVRDHAQLAGTYNLVTRSTAGVFENYAVQIERNVR